MFLNMISAFICATSFLLIHSQNIN